MASVTADELRAALDQALAERRHVILRLQGCQQLSAGTIALIESERPRFAEAGLDLMAYGASGIVRQLVNRALTKEDRGALPTPAHLMTSRPSSRAA